MSNLWTVNTGHNLGTYQESITQTIPLPINTVDIDFDKGAPPVV